MASLARSQDSHGYQVRPAFLRSFGTVHALVEPIASAPVSLQLKERRMLHVAAAGAVVPSRKPDVWDILIRVGDSRARIAMLRGQPEMTYS